MRLAGAIAVAAIATQPALAANRLQSKLKSSLQHSNPAQGNGAEINAFDPVTQEIYVTVANGADMLDKAVSDLALLDLNSDRRNGLSIEPEKLVVWMVGGRRWLFVGFGLLGGKLRRRRTNLA